MVLSQSLQKQLLTEFLMSLNKTAWKREGESRKKRHENIILSLCACACLCAHASWLSCSRLCQQLLAKRLFFQFSVISHLIIEAVCLYLYVWTSLCGFVSSLKKLLIFSLFGVNSFAFMSNYVPLCVFFSYALLKWLAIWGMKDTLNC